MNILPSRRSKTLTFAMLALVVAAGEAFSEPSGLAPQKSTLRPDRPALARVPAFDLHREALLAGRTGSTSLAQPAQPAPRDTLRNGAILGALVGAAALGTFAAVICNLQQEPGTGNCLADTLRVTAVGAGIGLGAGLALDAALFRDGAITLRMGLTF